MILVGCRAKWARQLGRGPSIKSGNVNERSTCNVALVTADLAQQEMSYIEPVDVAHHALYEALIISQGKSGGAVGLSCGDNSACLVITSDQRNRIDAITYHCA